MVFFQVFFFFTTMLLVNLFIALLLDNFDLMASEDMSISDMDIELFKRKWSQDDVPDERSAKGHRRTMHDGMHLYEIRHFVMQSGLGTFSMMYQADPYFFNRVLFELGYTAQHLHESTPAFPGYRGRSGLGTKVIKVPFPDLLLALCHIRFSSSCLSLAEEVEKSRVLVERYQAHAAKMLQVAARMFAVMTSFASSNDSLGRRCVIEGGAFALSWWFGAKVNWDSLSSTSYASYGGLMRAQRRALRLQRALQRDEAFRAALDFVGRASALFAYGSIFLGVLACVVKIAAAAIDSASSTTPTGKNAAGTTKHKKNVPSMRTPVGFVLGKASSRDVASPTPPTNSAALRAADASLSPLVV